MLVHIPWTVFFFFKIVLYILVSYLSMNFTVKLSSSIKQSLIFCVWIERLNVMQVAKFTKLIYKCNASPIRHLSLYIFKFLLWPSVKIYHFLHKDFCIFLDLFEKYLTFLLLLWMFFNIIFHSFIAHAEEY